MMTNLKRFIEFDSSEEEEYSRKKKAKTTIEVFDPKLWKRMPIDVVLRISETFDRALVDSLCVYSLSEHQANQLLQEAQEGNHRCFSHSCDSLDEAPRYSCAIHGHVHCLQNEEQSHQTRAIRTEAWTMMEILFEQQAKNPEDCNLKPFSWENGKYISEDFLRVVATCSRLTLTYVFFIHYVIVNQNISILQRLHDLGYDFKALDVSIAVAHGCYEVLDFLTKNNHCPSYVNSMEDMEDLIKCAIKLTAQTERKQMILYIRKNFHDRIIERTHLMFAIAEAQFELVNWLASQTLGYPVTIFEILGNNQVQVSAHLTGQIFQDTFHSLDNFVYALVQCHDRYEKGQHDVMFAGILQRVVAMLICAKLTNLIDYEQIIGYVYGQYPGRSHLKLFKSILINWCAFRVASTQSLLRILEMFLFLEDSDCESFQLMWMLLCRRKFNEKFCTSVVKIVSRAIQKHEPDVPGYIEHRLLEVLNYTTRYLADTFP